MNYENQASVCFSITCPLDVRNRGKGCPMWQTCQFYTPEKRSTYAATGSDSTSESGSYTRYDGTGKMQDQSAYDGTGEIRDHSAFKISNINPTNIIHNNIDELEGKCNKMQSDLTDLTDKMNTLSSATASSIQNLNDSVNKLKNETDYLISNVNNKVDSLREKTTEHVLELNRSLGTYHEKSTIHENTLFAIIFSILQSWPMRFLNYIFKWWTYEIENEYFLEHGHVYEFYVSVVLRGNMTREQMNRCTKRFNAAVKSVKKKHKKNGYGIHDIEYVFKPSFTIM